MHDIIRDAAGVLERAVQKNGKLADVATRIYANLRSTDDVLTAFWLRHHIFQHGLFGRHSTDRRAVWLNADQTKALTVDFAKEMRTKHLNGILIPCRYDLQPVYTMLDTGDWDSVCQKKLQDVLTDDEAIDGFTLYLYGSSYSTEKKTIEAIVGYDFFVNRVKQRIASPSFGNLHESVQLALKKAADPPF